MIKREDLYKLVDTIGNGGFGQVVLVKRKSDKQKFAKKIIDLGPLTEEEVEIANNEVKIHEKFSHPNIVGLKESFIDDRNQLCLIMEYAEKGDLQRLMFEKFKKKEPFTEE